MSLLKLSVVLLTLVLGGCAIIPQDVTLQPVIPGGDASAGKGAPVTVDVIDERPSSSLGHRGFAYGDAAEIKAGSDLKEIIKTKIEEGLVARGFAVSQEASSTAAKLKVEIRLVEYSSSQGLFTFGIHTRTTLKALATVGVATYEELYREESERRWMIVPTAEKNEEWINASISGALQQLLDDPKLAAFLTGR